MAKKNRKNQRSGKASAETQKSSDAEPATVMAQQAGPEDREPSSDRGTGSKIDESSEIDDDQDVIELTDEDIESLRVTGRYPSQRDRDLK